MSSIVVPIDKEFNIHPVAVLTILVGLPPGGPSAANPTSTENGVIVLAPETSPVVPHV